MVYQRGVWEVLRPYPSQLEALHAVADGCSLTEAGAKIGIDRQALGARLSAAYDRLKIDKGLDKPGTSQERRWKAIRVCIDQGWWPYEPPGDLRPVPARARR